MRKLFRWAGAFLFILSLTSFLAVYGWRLRVPAPTTGAALEHAITNVVLFAIFALHHSIMARTGAKAWLTRRLPPDLERSAYVWIASLLFLAVCWLWQPLPGVVWSAPAILMLPVQVAGVWLTLRAAGLVGIWELSGIQQPDHDTPVAFTTKGPFGIVRHPIYLGWVLMVFATPMMTASRLLFAAVSTAYLILAIPFEERSLVESFGEQYRVYQAQVKWRLIPGIW